MDPVTSGSARRHGVADDAVLLAHRNPVRIFELTMPLGPDRAGRLPKIGMASAEGIGLVVHAVERHAR